MVLWIQDNEGFIHRGLTGHLGFGCSVRLQWQPLWNWTKYLKLLLSFFGKSTGKSTVCLQGIDANYMYPTAWLWTTICCPIGLLRLLSTASDPRQQDWLILGRCDW